MYQLRAQLSKDNIPQDLTLAFEVYGGEANVYNNSKVFVKDELKLFLTSLPGNSQLTIEDLKDVPDEAEILLEGDLDSPYKEDHWITPIRVEYLVDADNKPYINFNLSYIDYESIK